MVYRESRKWSRTLIKNWCHLSKLKSIRCIKLEGQLKSPWHELSTNFQVAKNHSKDRPDWSDIYEIPVKVFTPHGCDGTEMVTGKKHIDDDVGRFASRCFIHHRRQEWKIQVYPCCWDSRWWKYNPGTFKLWQQHISRLVLQFASLSWNWIIVERFYKKIHCPDSQPGGASKLLAARLALLSRLSILCRTRRWTEDNTIHPRASWMNMKKLRGGGVEIWDQRPQLNVTPLNWKGH